MKVSELKKALAHINGRYEDDEVVVVVKTPHQTVGGTPIVPVSHANAGFDWDNGKFMIFPEEKLQKADIDYDEKYAKLEKDYGWLYYENRNLKNEIKKLRKQLKELEKDVDK